MPRDRLDLSYWGGRYERPTACNCAEMQIRNARWQDAAGYVPIGWDCPVHGVMHSQPDGTPYQAIIREPKRPKSKGALKREAWERLQQRRLFEDVA